jgi:hypothetical protein
MKRIVDGVTYNTETATLLATSTWTLQNQYSPHYGAECDGELYQTRGGAFFVITTIHTSDRDGEKIDKFECQPLSAEKANRWILDGDVEIIHNPFDEPPEAEAEAEPSSTIYVRVPPALKHQVEQAAATSGVSVNIFALRCLERCVASDKVPAPPQRNSNASL